MWPELLRIGSFSITLLSLFIPVAVVWGSFRLWQRLRSDFSNEEVFSFTIFMVSMIFAGGAVMRMLESRELGLSGLGMVLGAGLVVWNWQKNKLLDGWEVLDFMAQQMMLLGLIGSILWGPEAKYFSLLLAAGCLILAYIKTKYKDFRWYRSGRLGLVGLSGIVWYGIAEIVVAIFQPAKVYWLGLTPSQLVAGWLIAGSLVLIYLRSGRKLNLVYKKRKYNNNG